MKSLHRVPLCMVVLIVSVLTVNIASAQTGTVMIVADHRDPSSIPSSSEIFTNAYKEISKVFSRKGLRTLPASEVASARRLGAKIERNLGLAVEAARNSRGRVSTLLGVKIFITMHRGAKSNSFKVWIDGEARDVTFGKVKAKHEQRSKKRHTVEKSCGRDCMLERAIEAVKPTATKFATKMVGLLGK